MSKEFAGKRIGVILAGGGSRRMEGRDKAVAELAGKRLVDHVIDRLKAQTDRLLISGVRDFETGLTAIPDRDNGPSGPAAGLWAVASWMTETSLPATWPADRATVPLVSMTSVSSASWPEVYWMSSTPPSRWKMCWPCSNKTPRKRRP